MGSDVCYLSLSSAATLSQYDSLTQDQCDNIVSKLQTSLPIVDMPVVAEVLYADKILTPEEFGKLQDCSPSCTQSLKSLYSVTLLQSKSPPPLKLQPLVAAEKVTTHTS